MAVDQFGDKWEPASTNKYENIKDLLSSDCTMQLPELYDDGSVDIMYVYQAVKDGYLVDFMSVETTLKFIQQGIVYDDLSDEELFLGPVILKDRPEYYSEYIAHEEQLMRKRALGEEKCAELLKNWEKYL